MSSSADLDVVVVGAGAAGVGAGRALAAAGCRFVILEARARVGGRAWTIEAGHGLAVDPGCEWLHSATVHPLVTVARTAGVLVAERSEERLVRKVCVSTVRYRGPPVH